MTSLPITELDVSPKIHNQHLARLAVVYIRQSTVQQMQQHRESTRLQYGLVARAQALGWPPERIIVIDDDLGKSASTASSRSGFQRLVAEVSLGHVGFILGIEMSRLARTNVDWHRLLEVCALFRTLIADLDGIYDPNHYNDRLLLGLKGTMSEAELHILKQRLYQGCLNKARRGELAFALPIGYVWGPEQEIQFDPDEQVQEVVRLIFRLFEILGTVGGVLRYLAQHDIRLGVRVREGTGKGTLLWRRPNRMTLQNMLKHPLYAGAYVYGRRQDDPRRKQLDRPRSGRVVMPQEQWHAFLPDRVPAYLTWDQYELHLSRLTANQARTTTIGAVRNGTALLAGLVTCGRCGCRMVVHYAGKATLPTYECSRQRGTYGGPLCQHVAGACLDTFVSQQALAALQPAALELSLVAAEQIEQERERLDHLWQQRRERVAYEVERAARQYHAVEPENRLVARTLERTWEEGLQAQQRLDEDYRRFHQHQPQGLTEEERNAIRCLAADIPALWSATTTTAAERKDILRQIIERVEVTVQGVSEQVAVRIHWVGGSNTEGQIRRPVAHWEDRSDYVFLRQRVTTLTQAGWPAAKIAQQFTSEEIPALRNGRAWSAQGVLTLRTQAGLRGRRQSPSTDGLAADEWWASELARTLAIPRACLHAWIHQGHVQARQEVQGWHRWIVRADADEQERLRQHHQRDRADEARQRWTIPSLEKEYENNV